MAKAAFIILRLATATAALLGLAGMVMVIVFTATVTMLKGGASIIAALATMIGSGFQRETSSPPPGPLTPMPLVGLAFVFGAMFVSVFLPGQRIYLHIVAAAVIFGAWRLWSVTANPETPMFYLPMIVLWFLYYAVCLRRG